MCQGATITFTDGDFAGWTFFDLSSPGSSAATTIVGSGNPAPCLQVTTVTGPSAFAGGLGTDWDLQAAGAISRIDASIDVKSISGWGSGQGLELVAYQDGRLYGTPCPLWVSVTGPSTSWHTMNFHALTAAHFAYWPSPDTVVLTQHPNFSATGSPISFGFMAGNNSSGTYRQLYDNWSITLTGDFLPAVPEPGSLAMLGIGALGLGAFAWRRRKNG
jgi:hypothetical protein